MPLQMWIALCAALNCAGWVLSWPKALGAGGYTVVLGLFCAWASCQVKRGWAAEARRSEKKMRRRFQRPVAFVYLLTAAMALTSGLLCTTWNWDAMAYRVPRVLHWLHEGGWHWIHTEDVRLNVVAPGVEWFYAPLLEFTHTDHLLFLSNWVSFLFLPGLIFSVYRGLGVRARVAWWWMWLLPCASCYALQASSLANDAYAAVYALAALDFALRARKSGRVADVWYSTLAAALLTGVKQSNLPLLLPWAVAIWPSLRLLRPRLWSSAAVAMVGLLSSAGPISWLNAAHTGSWKGFAPGRDLDPGSPLFALAGNVFTVAVQNAAPPVFPLASQTRWNVWMESFVATPFGSHFAKFDHFGYLASSTSEINAGLGPAMVLLLVWSLWRAWRLSYGDAGAPRGRAAWLMALRICPWVSAAVFAAKVSSLQIGRYLSVYYPLMLPLVLAGAGHGRLVRRAGWRRVALASGLVTVVFLATIRVRPPWPAAPVLSWLHQKYPASRELARLEFAFGFPAYRRGQIRTLLEKVPEGEAVLGYATQAGTEEVDLWKPWGRRQAVRVSFHDGRLELARQGVRYVVVDHTALMRDMQVFIEASAYPGEKDPPIGIEVWASHLEAEVVAETEVRLARTGPPAHWYLLRMKD